jgi:hypothetical protein
MKIYKVYQKDIDEIEKLIKITTFIDKLYTKLYELEVNGQKKSNEYIETIECLNLNIGYENAYYEGLSEDKYEFYFEYLYNTKITNKYLSNQTSILKQDYTDRIIRRILSTLHFKIHSNPKHLTQELPEYIKDVLAEMDEDTSNTMLEHSANASIQMTNAIDKDLFNMYLSILDEFINNKDYKMFNKYLINSKYNLSFINKEIEKTLVKNNFSISKEIYVSATFVNELNGLTPEVYEFLTDLSIFEIVKEQLIEILEISDMDYSDIYKATTSILRQCLMRAGISFLSDTKVLTLSSIYEEHTQSETYLNNHQYDYISKQVIATSLQNIKKDKSKKLTLSLHN